MAERGPIELNIQLPAGTLEGLTRLVTELRYLAAAVRGESAAGGTLLEAGKNPAFNPKLFRTLEDTAEAGRERPATAVPEPVVLPLRWEAETAEAAAVRSGPFPQTDTPGGAGFPVSPAPETPAGSRSGTAEKTPATDVSAPDTLQALSQALRRDERRYDSGFPLY